MNVRGGRSKKTSEALDTLRKELGGNESAVLILSGEGVCSLPLDAVAALKALLLEYVDHVRVVAYIRSPIGYMESAFQQRLKANSVDLRGFAGSYPQYRVRFEKFDRVFGRENVDLWKFEPKTFPNGCVVRDFCSRLGIALPPDRIVRVNEGLSRNAVSLLYAYRKHFKRCDDHPPFQRADKEVVERLSGLGGSKLRFSPTMVGPLVHANGADIEWMESRLGSSLREVIDAEDEACVATEEDLLRFEQDALAWLEGQLPGRRSPKNAYPTAQYVAAGMRTLVDRIAGDIVRRRSVKHHLNRGGSEMNMQEIIAKAKEAAPDRFASIQEGKAVALVREVFKQIVEEIESVEEGVVKVGGFGQFRIMKAEREKDGRRVAVRRVSFRGAAARGSDSTGQE